MRSAIGEGVERYAASLWNPDDLSRSAPYEKLAGRAFDPRWLVLYDEEQSADAVVPVRSV